MTCKLLVIAFFALTFSSAQITSSSEKEWSAENRLNINDFLIQTNINSSSDKIYSQFAITHAISGFDFMKRNLNQKVKNTFISRASWIDTSQTTNEINAQIEYQQLQFDLAEIQTRTIRKQAFINKRTITKGLDVIEQIVNDALVEFSNQRLKLFQETNGGSDQRKLKEWKSKIDKDLLDLDQFRFENKSRIKLDN